MDRTLTRRSLSRRHLLGGSAGVAASLLAGRTGLLAQEASPAAVPSANLGKDFGGATIRIATIAEYYAYAFRMFQEQVEKELNVKLSIEVVPAADLYARNMQDYVGGSTSYDVAYFLPYQLPDFAPHLDPIGDLMTQYGLDPKLDDILPAFKNFYTTWDGKHMTVPFDGDHHLMLYNKDAFSNADLQAKFESENGYPLAVPETYDQYLQMAKFFQENPWRTDGGTGYGVAEGYLNPSWWFENRLASSGAVYFDEQMNPLINTPNAIMAAQNLVDLAPFNPPGSNTFGYQEVENAIAQGDVALSINWSSAFRTSMDPNKSKVVGKIGTAVTPGFMVNDELIRHDALCTGWVLGIPTYGPQKEAATYVAWYYTRPEVHTAMILDPNTGVDAYRLSSIEDPAFAEKYGEEFVTTINDSITLGFPDLQVPNAFEYYTSLDNQLREAVTGGKSVEDAMNQIATEWNEITDRMGRDLQIAAWNTAYTAMKDAGITYVPLA